MTTKTNDAALSAFMANKAEIDTLLAEIQAFSDEHFGYTPDEIHWGHLWTAPAMQELSLAR